jgi:hypothetical protein
MIIGYVPFSFTTPTHGDAVLGLSILFFCLPVIVLISGAMTRMGRRRRPVEFIEGVCGRGGYSLRGLPGATCPECGADTSRVGTRRPLRHFSRGTWLACAVWIALVLGVNSVWRFEIEGYLLRLLWNVEEYTRWLPPDHPTGAYRLALVAMTVVMGALAILWISRREASRRR